jgi:hypothetical protein
MTLTQILGLVGELNDAAGENTPRERFRRFLTENAQDVAQVRDFVQDCLRESGTQRNRALQDLVNHLGTLLGFKVTFGRYAGVQGQNGFDGHWESPTGFHVVAEVKTTDAYAINTATALGYVNGLISTQNIPKRDVALGLYVVARPDAELRQLENAIIAEGRTHELRVVSVESLLSLAETMTEYDVTHQDILDILKPSGPRIDPTVELIGRLVGQSKAESVQPAAVAAPAEPPVLEPRKRGAEVPSTAGGGALHWLTPVRAEEDETAEECIARLVGDGKFYAFSERAPSRGAMKAGDKIAFYANTKGVVAHATLLTAPQRTPRPDGSVEPEYPWVCSLTDAVLYLEEPIAIDAELRQRLDAFKGRDLSKPWAWFVQANHRVTGRDFALLTRA